METTTITASQLRERMQQRHVSQTALAHASGMHLSAVSAILSGRLRFGPQREARLAQGIVRLGLDKDTPQPPPPAAPVVIRIRQL